VVDKPQPDSRLSSRFANRKHVSCVLHVYFCRGLRSLTAIVEDESTPDSDRDSKYGSGVPWSAATARGLIRQIYGGKILQLWRI